MRQLNWFGGSISLILLGLFIHNNWSLIKQNFYHKLLYETVFLKDTSYIYRLYEPLILRSSYRMTSFTRVDEFLTYRCEPWAAVSLA